MIDPFKNPDLKRGDRITFLEPGNENGKQSNPHLVGRGGYVYSIRADKGELHILYDLAIGEKQPFEKVLEGKTGFSFVTCKKEHYTGCLAMELDNYGDRAEGVNPDFSKGDRVKVIDYPQGPPHLDFAGREGTVHRLCSSVFPNFVYVEFDLKGRERVQKVKMCDKLNIKAIQPTYKSGDPVLISDQHHLFPNRTAKIREHTDNIPKDSIYVEVDRKPDENITSTIPIKLDLIRPIGLLSFKNLPKQPKAMEQTIHQIAEIELKLIHESDLNPRKSFDQHSIEELAISIQEKGVLQPILVREIMDSFPQEYDIVCGARRYRASLKAGMKTIPAIVRNLDDEEALEMMIIENLQRKDVNPMEEASAIHSLLKHYGNYSEVALRLGKSSRFVAERDTLNNLHENFQTFLYDGEISLGAAYALAKHSVESQQLILDEYSEIKDGELKMKHWVTNSNLIQACERNACDLTQATFDLEDTSFDKAPACSACQSNTANQPVLFQEGNPTCLDAVCFRIKTKTAFNQQLIQAIEDGKILVLSKWGSLEDPGTEMIIKENGATYINRDNFEYLTKPKAPEAPMTLEEVRKEYMEYNDIEEEKALSAEDLEAIQEEFEDGQNDYQEELKDYQEELEQFNQRNSDPLVREAFVIGGYDHVGKSITIRLRGTAAVKASTSQNTSPEAEQIQEQIDKIDAREARAEKLDREKIYTQAWPLLGNDWMEGTKELYLTEKRSLIIALCSQYYELRENVQKMLDIKDRDYGLLSLYKRINQANFSVGPTDDLVNYCLRFTIQKGLIDASTLDYEKSGRPAAIMDIVRNEHPKELAEIELNQQGIALARKEKVEKKQADLKAKLAKLEESEESHD